MARSSRSTAITRRAPCGEQRARQPARSGADLDHVDAVERSGGARDAGGEIEVEQKVLTERLLGVETVSADHLAQRREIVDGAHQRVTRSSRATIAECDRARLAAATACRSAAIRLAGIGAAGAGDVEGGAVVGRGAHERQAQRDVDRVVERQRLDRDQRLVVIHAERDVVGRARA